MCLTAHKILVQFLVIFSKISLSRPINLITIFHLFPVFLFSFFFQLTRNLQCSRLLIFLSADHKFSLKLVCCCRIRLPAGVIVFSVIIGHLEMERDLNFLVVNILLFYSTDEDFFAKDVKNVKK